MYIAPVSEMTQFIMFNSRQIAVDGWAKIYEVYGGLAAFTDPVISDDMRELRNTLLSHEEFPVSIYNDIVGRTAKFSRSDIRHIAGRSHVFNSYDLFRRFWKADPKSVMDALGTFLMEFEAASEFSEKDAWWGNLPTVHADDCRGDDPTNSIAHWGCRTMRVIHADIHLEIMKRLREDAFRKIDPRVLDTIQSTVLSLNEKSREVYAQSIIVRDDHWDTLADDKRSVLNAISENALLPTRVAEKIIAQHKTPRLREEIAKNTTSPELLQSIWSGTKSESIRAAVEENSLFVRPS